MPFLFTSVFRSNFELGGVTVLKMRMIYHDHMTHVLLIDSVQILTLSRHACQDLSA